MRRFFLLVFEGPRRPWYVTPLLVAAYPVAWFLLAAKLPQPLIWLIPWLLLLWWQAVRFAEVGHYARLSQRTFDWTCPMCRYPLAKLKADHDPRTSRCPECGHVPAEVLRDAREKVERAGRW